MDGVPRFKVINPHNACCIMQEFLIYRNDVQSLQIEESFTGTSSEFRTPLLSDNMHYLVKCRSR